MYRHCRHHSRCIDIRRCFSGTIIRYALVVNILLHVKKDITVLLRVVFITVFVLLLPACSQLINLESIQKLDPKPGWQVAISSIPTSTTDSILTPSKELDLPVTTPKKLLPQRSAIPVATTSLVSTTVFRISSTLTPILAKTVVSKTVSSDCNLKVGKFEMGEVSIPEINQPLEYRIYLPPCYGDLKNQRYPVLYLIHGHGFKDDQWDRIGADEAANRLISSGEIPPFLIVMPYDLSTSQPTQSHFAQALIEELIPHIDAQYRTIPKREYRAVGGLSRGGGWAIHLGLRNWQEFGALGAHSPAVFHTDADRMESLLEDIPVGKMPKIFIDIGDRDLAEIMLPTLDFEMLLNRIGIPHEWHLFNGYHSEDYWRTHLDKYLRWYTKGWENASVIISP